MIIWLASYPKSGNTLVRSMLSAYNFSRTGEFNFQLLQNIKQFPNKTIFNYLGVDTSNKLEIVKNYISAQEEINKRDGNSIRFIKTHAALQSINGYPFTNYKNSLGAIYIVRDPRKVVLSYANHYQVALEESLKQLSSEAVMVEDISLTNIGTWSSNYNSWKEFKKLDRYLLIKYEDLILKPRETLILILEFIYKLTKTKFVLDELKLKNVLKTTTFEYLQNLEKKESFPESRKTKDGKLINFFKYGKKNTGKNLPEEINKNIEENFSLEMKELGYLL
tara:strand:- start:666 stop:1499 length:834 start_codon:yes stop_codon:yes gene_type:complete